MRHATKPVFAYAAALLLAAACNGGRLEGDCFDSGATPYRVDLHLDTSLTFRWPASYSPVRFYAENTGALRANTDFALGMWRDAFRCGETAMVRVTDSLAADVILRNPSQMPPIPAPPMNAALVLHAGDSLSACDARTDIEVDTVAHKVLRPIRVYLAPADLDTAAVNACYRITSAHEIGHTLGLFAHSPDPGDLMYTNPQKRELSINDRYTIQLVYHNTPHLTPSAR